MKVTPNTVFGEILEEYPESEAVLVKYLGAAYCLTCPGKMFDTIGNGAMIHGLSDEATTEMVNDLQKVVDAAEGGQQAGEGATAEPAPHDHDHDHSAHDHDHSDHDHSHEDEDDDLIV